MVLTTRSEIRVAIAVTVVFLGVWLAESVWLWLAEVSVDWRLWLLGLVWTFVAALGLINLLWYQRTRREGVAVPGTLIDYAIEMKDRSTIYGYAGTSWIYWPKIRFSSPDGQVREFETRWRPWWLRPTFVKPGKQVQVRYPPGRPQHAFLDRGWRMWYLQILSVAVWTLAMLLIPLLVLTPA